MNRLAAVILATGFVAGLVTFSAASLVKDEPRSAFMEEGAGAWPLVNEAKALGFQTRRIISTPGPFIGDGQEPPERTLFVVVDAPQGFTPQEVTAVHEFLEAGGRVLLADPYGNADGLSTSLGIRFQRVRLVDPEPNATARVDGSTFNVRWDNPSALQVDVGTPVTILASSSSRSFLDRDGNGTIDTADPRGSFVIAAELAVGSKGGLLLVVADHGAMRGPHAAAADNPLWRRALLSHLLPGGGRMLVDESRQPAHNPLVSTLAPPFAASAHSPWSWGMVGLGILLLFSVRARDATTPWGAHHFEPRRFIRRAQASSQPVEKTSEGTAWTWRGSLALSASFSLLLLGFVFNSPTAVGAGSLLILSLMGAVLRAPMRMHATRHLSTHRPTEGMAVDATISLSTHSRWPVEVEVRDELPAEYEITGGVNWISARVRRSQSIRLGYTFTPALRGPYFVGPLTTRIMDPLHLRGSNSVAAQKDEVLVAPRQESVRRIPFTTRVPTVTLGPHLVNRAGEGSEFHALRDYSQGDSLRSVNWKASARSHGLMVNQRVHESMTRLVVLLDARAISGAGPAVATPLADGCRAALSIAAGALRVRDRIHVVAYGNGLTAMRDAPGSRQLHELQEMLSMLPAGGDMGLAQAVEQLGAALRSNTPVLILSGAEADDGFVPGLQTLRNRGCIPVVVASPIHVQPEGDAGPAEPRAQELVAQRTAALGGARALGIPVYETVEGLPLEDLFRLGAQT